MSGHQLAPVVARIEADDRSIEAGRETGEDEILKHLKKSKNDGAIHAY